MDLAFITLIIGLIFGVTIFVAVVAVRGAKRADPAWQVTIVLGTFSGIVLLFIFFAGYEF